MSKPLFLHYTYYHCSKSRQPFCQQKSITKKELEEQIHNELGRISIFQQFKDWAVKYLHELQAQDTQSQQEILRSQQQALRACLGQIEGLVGLKTSLDNRDGSLISDAEYAERRARLLKEKTSSETAIQNLDAQMEQMLKLSEQALDFAGLV